MSLAIPKKRLHIQLPPLGALHFQTDLTTDSQRIVLRTTNGRDSITTSLA